VNNQQPTNLEENFSKYAINDEVGKSSIRQIKHSSRKPEFPVDFQNEINQVLRSWYQVFIYKEEMPEYDIEGLRPPQIGAVHAIHAHWAVSSEAATIVLPTGIGKTETMLSILITQRCRRLLVVVPTDALRTQISEKILTLGILKQIGVVSRDALFPIVGTLKHIPNSVEEVDHFFAKCQVIVTTMKIVAESKPEIQQKISHYCPFLFVDEAHHVAAPTWAKFIERFSERKVLFFTATPFRNDGKSIGGKIIFNYPLRKAQEEGYFRPITFKPVTQFDPEESDIAIAEKAVEQLRSDLQQYDHILMARVQSIKRAEEVFEIYQKFPEYNAVQIHTGIKSHQEREEIRKKIINKQTRIVVCVDMLGEGFDLPELKIAAFHDVKKSLPVTLQLAGRFTRARADLGDPTFIANIADNNVQDELRKLYSQDADWNILLRRSSDTFIQEQLDLWELLSGFDELSEDIPLQNVKIAMSAVVYRTQCDNWTPENFAKGIQSLGTYDWVKHATNDQHNILIVLTAKKMFLPWIKSDEFFHWKLDLYVVYWDKVQNLLFINQSSSLSSMV